MPNLTRTTPRTPARTNVPAPKTKILLVRQPVKSVRKSDEPDRTGLRLAIGVIVAIGSIVALWILGYLGFRLGFAPLVRVPDLAMEDAGGLATGAMMLMSLPSSILQAGIAQPMWLMIAFAMIAIPAATLGALEPAPTPGGPKPKAAVVALSIIGSILAMLNAAALTWWTISPVRARLIGELPFNPAGAQGWLLDLQTAGGMDALGAIAAALWVVVAMKLTVPFWLRALSASACFFALAVIAVAMSITNAGVAQITASRSVFFMDDGSLDTPLVLGFTPRSMAALRVNHNATFVDLMNREMNFTVVGQQSIVEFLRERTPREE